MMKHSSHQFGDQFSGFGKKNKVALVPVIGTISRPALLGQS